MKNDIEKRYNHLVELGEELESIITQLYENKIMNRTNRPYIEKLINITATAINECTLMLNSVTEDLEDLDKYFNGDE